MPPRYLVGAALLLIVVTCVAYFPAMQGGFLLDDDKLLASNQLVKSPDGPYQFWCTTNATDYWPMTNTSFWIEWRLWGNNPTGYHVTNLLLHIIAALLIWAILRKLAIPGAFLAALLFAVHPVNVESVAWISQRKNTLAMVFFLLSILWYLRAIQPRTADDRPRTRSWYWISLLAFLLAMLSKGSVAVLPVMLLLIVWWQRRRIDVSDILQNAPFFVVAIVLTGVNIWFQKHGIDVVFRDVNFIQRLIGAGAVVWFYLSKAAAPIHLIFVYPQWQIEARQFLWWLPFTAATIVTILLFWRQWRGRSSLPAQTAFSRALFFAWLFFCVALVPVLGFTDVGFMQYSLVADHYQHIALIAVAALAAAAWSAWRRQASEFSRPLAIAAAAGIVGLLTVLTFQQSQLYGNVIALYQDTVEKNPECWMAENNLGTAFLNAGRPQEAILHIKQMLRLKPDSPEAHFNLSSALDNLGQSSQAIEELQLAISLRPNFPEAHSNLGNLLKQSGKLPEAISEYRIALQEKPDYPEAHNNLGNALLGLGQFPEAIQHINEAVRLKPDLAEGHYNLGLLYTTTKRMQEAIDQYQQALLLKPNYPEAHNNLGYTLAAVGRVPEAIEQYRQSIQLSPTYPEVHYNLALALAKTGRLPEAIEQYRQTLKLKPDYPEAYNDLGNALYTTDHIPEAIQQYRHAIQLSPKFVEPYNGLGAALMMAGRPQEAIEQYQQALRLKPDYAAISNNLAAAYAQLNRPAEAITAAEKALELARAQGQTALVNEVEACLKSYRAQQTKSRGTSPSQNTPKAP